MSRLNYQNSSFNEKMSSATVREKKSAKKLELKEEEITSHDQPSGGTSQDQIIQKLILEISQLKEELLIARSQIAIYNEELTKTLKEEKKAKDNIALTKKELMKAGKQSVEELRKSYEAIKEEVVHRTEEDVAISQQFKAYVRQLDDSNEKLRNLKERNQKLQDELDVAQRSALKDQEKFQDLKRANMSKISHLEEELTVAHSQLAKTLKEEKKAKDSIALTKNELMKAGTRSVEELRKSYEKMKEQLQQKTDEDVAAQQVKTYKRQLDDSNEKLSNLKERNQKLQDELDAAERSALKDQEKFQDLKRANVVLQKKLQESKLKIQELEVAEREYIVNQKQVETQQKDIKALQEALESTGRQSWLVSNEEVQFSDEMIGEGSYGNVRVAVFRGTRVAAKSIHSIIISDYNRDIFIREMSLSAAVRHPNIVQFIGAADLANPILLYELMTTSLHSHLQKGQPLTHPQILDAGCDIAAALTYLHQHKPHPIIHRDVSSPNVLMDPLPKGKWKYKLSDLGAANLQCYVKTKYPGNPCYAAPEASDWNCQSPAMDVYSFGVLLMEITLNRAPETECGLRTLQAKRIQWNPVRAIVEQCIVEDRFQRQLINYVLQHLRSL